MTHSETEDRVIALIGEFGPMRGKELFAKLDGVDYLALWQACFLSERLQISQFSRYYLRYDITREDMIRISPSILRDFLSFTIISLPEQRNLVMERLVRLSNEHREISIWKMGIARRIMMGVVDILEPAQLPKMCGFLAGDLTYFLGHSEPRFIPSINQTVNGSDIDIIIVHDGLPDQVIQDMDEVVLTSKNYYLRHPDFVQEVDYVIKGMDKMMAQFGYKGIKDKIACKIVYESLFLAGSVDLYDCVLEKLKWTGALKKIQDDFETGLASRAATIRELRDVNPKVYDENTRSLFYFSQERVEFE
ncbi:MAG: hypothetical protein AAFX02_01925 [Pseudomonadota bacterium]